MKYTKIILLCCILMLAACQNEKGPVDKKSGKTNAGGAEAVSVIDTKEVESIDRKPQTLDEKFSYLQGYETARQMKQLGMQMNTDYFILGIKHATSKDSLKFYSHQEMTKMEQEIMQETQKKMQSVMADKKKEFIAAGKKAKAAGEKFLAENKKKAGIKTTASGLQYEILKEGNGKTTAPGDIVVANIKAMKIDGTVFEDTFKDKPATFRLDQNVMPAWREALMMMKPGDMLKLYAPSELCFGPNGAFPEVPPYSVLVFQIQLLENKGKSAK